MQASPRVPRDCTDPINFLLESGESPVSLAFAWGYRTVDTVMRLKRYDCVPPTDTAQKIAETFGWTPGEVLDFWIAAVAEREKATA
jgi:hypothetical protein